LSLTPRPMPSPSQFSREEPARAERIDWLPLGRCFLGLPVRAAPIERDWLIPVLDDLLRRHERVLLLLESELDSYAGSLERSGNTPAPGPSVLDERANEETMSRWREADAIRHCLPESKASRVQIATWAHFIDPSFVALWRHLLARFGATSVFRRDAQRQGAQQPHAGWAEGAGTEVARVASLRAIESLAMRLRVGEIAGYHLEYGRGDDAPLAAHLYAGKYAADGLTVESLVGHPAQRRYLQLA